MLRATKYLRDLSWMDDYRVLRPLRPHLQSPRMGRHAVAGGVAVGIFFGILTPVAQMLFAVIAAIALRANVAAAAVGTLVTNPLTFPFVYYFAFRVGAFVTGYEGAPPAEVALSQPVAAQLRDLSTWHDTLFAWVQSIGPPLATGMLVLAACSSLLSFLLVHLAWRWIEARRARRHKAA